MKETIDEFYDRIYLNTSKYPKKPYVLVWKSKKEKEMVGKKPEIWDLESVRNYTEFLQDEEKGSNVKIQGNEQTLSY